MITVIKASGEREPFSEEKLLSSTKRAGIPADIQEQVITYVKSKLYDNIPTSEIYQHISEFFAASHPHSRVKYNLKQAIMALGPTGYPFENFIAEIIKTQGYKTEVRSIIQGACISHEIDVIAQKESKDGREKAMIEAKFHNLPGIKTSIHVALYTKSRFDDIRPNNNFTHAWIITNTKATSDVIAYAQCSGIRVVSWSYPEKGNLRDLIEQSGLAPVTALIDLSLNQIQKLLEQGVVLCKDVCNKPSILDTLGIEEDKKQHILSEAAFACNLT